VVTTTTVPVVTTTTEPEVTTSVPVVTTTTATPAIDVSYLSYTTVSGTIRILGFITGQSREHLIIPETINQMPVTEIANQAFQGNLIIKTVVLPSSLTHIGNEAFALAENLVSVRIDGISAIRYVGNQAFSECKKLTSAQLVTSPELIKFSPQSQVISLADEEETVIFGELVFYKCNSLVIFVVPEGTKRIPQGMFTDCESLQVIMIPDSVVAIEDFAFAGCQGLLEIQLSSALMSIGAHAFSGCTSLATISFPSSLVSIGDMAFHQCYRLKVVVIPINVISMGMDVFVPNFEITHPLRVYIEASSLPSGWSEFFAPSYVGVFYGLGTIEIIDGFMLQPDENGWSVLGFVGDSMDQLNIPEMIQGKPVISIHSHAFSFQTQIKIFHIPRTVQTIGDSAFYDSGIEVILFEEQSQLRHLGAHVFEASSFFQTPLLPESILTIGGYAFYQCDGMTGEFKFPSQVQTLESYTLAYVSQLQSIVLPESLKRIETHSIIGVIELQWIIIPRLVEEIQMQGIADCPKAIILVENNAIGTNWNPDWNPQNRPVYFSAQSLVIESGFLFQVNQSQATLIKYLGEWDHSIVDIPQMVQGKVVSVIGASAFEFQTNITKITLPSFVQTIEAYAFAGCSKLETFEIAPNSILLEIQEGAFKNTTSLQAFYLPDFVQIIGDYAFDGASELTTFSISSSSDLQSIGREAFSKTRKLAQIFIPNSVQTIGYYAFSRMLFEEGNDFHVSLTIYVEATNQPQTWHDEWVEYESKPIAIIWDANQILYEGDYIYQIDSSGYVRLLRYIGDSSITSIVIPTYIQNRLVLHIGNRTFSGMKHLTSVTIPESIQTIGEGAFLRCQNLSVFILPNHLQWIGKDAFETKSNLITFVHSQGTVEQASDFTPGWLGSFGVATYRYHILQDGKRLPNIWLEAVDVSEQGLIIHPTLQDPDQIGTFKFMELLYQNQVIYSSNLWGEWEVDQLEPSTMYLVRVQIEFTIANQVMTRDFYYAVTTGSIETP
jgi:hypothetical protein